MQLQGQGLKCYLQFQCPEDLNPGSRQKSILLQMMRPPPGPLKIGKNKYFSLNREYLSKNITFAKMELMIKINDFNNDGYVIKAYMDSH